MDSRIVNQKAEALKTRTLRLTPALIQQLGLEKRNTNLKLDEFYISCVPFDLSLSGANLIAFLSPREIEFFGKLKLKGQKLSLSFMTAYAKKPVSFFVLVDVKSFRKPDPASPYCFIEVSFKEAPPDLKEILVTHFTESDEAEGYFKTAEDIALEFTLIPSILGSNHLSLLKQGTEASRLKPLSLSVKRLRVYGEIEGPPLSMGEPVDLEPSEGDHSGCLLHGTIVEFTPQAEIPGYAFFTVELQFNACLVSRIKKVIPTKKP